MPPALSNGCSNLSCIALGFLCHHLPGWLQNEGRQCMNSLPCIGCRKCSLLSAAVAVFWGFLKALSQKPQAKCLKRNLRSKRCLRHHSSCDGWDKLSNKQSTSQAGTRKRESRWTDKRFLNPQVEWIGAPHCGTAMDAFAACSAPCPTQMEMKLCSIP